MIIQPDILSNLTGLQQTKIDFSDRIFFKEGRHLEFALEYEIKDLLRKDLVSINDVKGDKE